MGVGKSSGLFLGRRTKGKKSLKSDAGVSVTSTREVLQKHYQHLGKISVRR